MRFYSLIISIRSVLDRNMSPMETSAMKYLKSSLYDYDVCILFSPFNV